MNETEIIDYLKKNKKECVIFMKMPKPVQDYFENTYKKIGYKMLMLDGTWSCNQYVIPLRADGVYTLPDDYEAPKVEPEVLEFDVDDKWLTLSLGQHEQENYVGEYEVKINNIPLTLTNNGILYRFIGYKFEGSNSKWNDYLLYRARDRNLFINSASDIKPVYANKVVYQKVEGK